MTSGLAIVVSSWFMKFTSGVQLYVDPTGPVGEPPKFIVAP